MIKLFFRSITIWSLIFLPAVLKDIIEDRVDGMILQTLMVIPLFIVFWGIAFLWLQSLESRRKLQQEDMGIEEYEKKYPFGAVQTIIVIMGFILGLFGMVYFTEVLK